MATAIIITATLNAMPKILIDTISPVDFFCEAPFNKRLAIYNSVFQMRIYLLADKNRKIFASFEVGLRFFRAFLPRPVIFRSIVRKMRFLCILFTTVRIRDR
jgi:hypothetical protein